MANTLAYCDMATFTSVTFFVVQTPGGKKMRQTGQLIVPDNFAAKKVFLIVRTPQVREGVDDDTEDEVKDDDDHDEEEQHVVDNPGVNCVNLSLIITDSLDSAGVLNAFST